MPPRLLLDPDGKPYKFARLVHEGYSYRDACRELGVSEETARKWRLRLRMRCGIRLPNGRLVSYERALREITPAFIETSGKPGQLAA